MAGRFPYAAPGGGGRPPQFTPQMAAALGMDEAMYLQRQQDLQRDYQLQQLILQEQLDHHIQEQHIRAIGEQLQDYPDLQQHYQNLLLNEQLQRSQVAQLRYQDEMRRPYLGGYTAEELMQVARHQQQQQLEREQQQREQLEREQLEREQHCEREQREQLQQIEREQQQQFQPRLFESALSPVPPLPPPASAPLIVSNNRKADKKRAREEATKDAAPAAAVSAAPPQMSKRLAPKTKPNKRGSKQQQATPPIAASVAAKPPESALASNSSHSKIASAPVAPINSKTKAAPAGRAKAKAAKSAVAAKAKSPPPPAPPLKTSTPEPGALFIAQKGTLKGLLMAAHEQDDVDEAADILNKLVNIDWSDLDEEEDEEMVLAPLTLLAPTSLPMSLPQPDVEQIGLPLPTEPAEVHDLRTYRSTFPKLPEEPVYDEAHASMHASHRLELHNDEQLDKKGVDEQSETQNSKKQDAGEQKVPEKAKISNILQYPYSVDTWWPSRQGVRQERHSMGETSDEDNFEDTPGTEVCLFRANDRKIKQKLANEVKPGVLEKLPHCRIHRVRTKRKKNSTAPELVYCWQVTEIYPNDIMVNCSKCGTWRHAACGGHYKPYSKRENTKVPFEAICDCCHEEENYLEEFPHGAKRLDRQRIEQTRRGLSTSAVMRHASFSKHGGTYKWPLGSVSATHIGGHTRSVHARHDKAEKQWTDMQGRLSRGYGYRQKERVRSRTKELERLLVSIEDAEGYTDRHNMLLFLSRDIARARPVGFEKHRRNIFDPDDDVVVKSGDTVNNGVHWDTKEAIARLQDEQDQHPNGLHVMGSDETVTNDVIGTDYRPRVCARQGCDQRCRFDSLFCSDGCGIAALEEDLLRTLYDASDIHPSTLRL